MLNTIDIDGNFTMITNLPRTTITARLWLRLVEWLIFSLAGISMASAAESSSTIATSPFMQWTSSIDVRTAFIVSALSVLVLFAVSKIDFKSPLGIWGGRFVIFALVILNIALWGTQV
jgi:hypothetical protein